MAATKGEEAAAEEVVTTKEEEVAAVCGWQPGRLSRPSKRAA